MSNTSLYSTINNWNLDKILQFTKLEYPTISNEVWEEAVSEYRNYMYLGLITGISLQIPNKIMDYIWHSHILHTQDYQNFCYAINNNKLIHHLPTLHDEVLANNNFVELSTISKKYLGYNAFETSKNIFIQSITHSCGLINSNQLTHSCGLIQ